ncbi:hypothetical protein FRC05_003389 [Tulasnella sp. 425]|nr:hypothetical protein FRC05_003389 [Tulasnella sp. 425]
MTTQSNDLEKGIPFVPDEPLPSPDERSNNGDGLGEGEGEPEFPTENASTSEDTITTPPPERATNDNDPPKDENPTPKPSQDVDSNVVTWDGPNDPANPQNWSAKKKWIATTIPMMAADAGVFPILFVSAGPPSTHNSPLASSMIAPALPQLSKEFGVVPVFNIACSRATTVNQMLAFRFFAGLGGSAPLAIGGGTIGDLFSADNRGKALSVYTLAPLTDAVIQLLGLVFLRETYAPKLLSIKTRRLRQETGNPKLRSMYTKPGHVDVYDASPLQWITIVAKGAMRPLKMLATQPIVQVFAVYQALLYGLMYLTLTTFAALWTQEYGYSVGIAGLHYIALGIGFTLGSQFGARGLDMIYKRLKARNGGVGTPEMRFVTPALNRRH